MMTPSLQTTVDPLITMEQKTIKSRIIKHPCYQFHVFCELVSQSYWKRFKNPKVRYNTELISGNSWFMVLNVWKD